MMARSRRLLLILLAMLTFALIALPIDRPVTATTPPIVQAESSLEQGRQLYAAGRYEDAIAVWQQSITQADSPEQALRFSYLALAYQKLGDWPQADRSIAQSFDRLAENSPPPLLAQIFNTQGQIKLAMGQPEAALESWQQAEQHYREADDAIGTVGSQINQAQALQTLGLYRRAQSLLEQINATLQTQPDSDVKALGLRSLGAVLQVTGNLADSEQALRQSLAIAQQLNLRSQISEIQFSLANTLRIAQNPEAVTLYQQAAASALTEFTRLQAQLNLLSLQIETRQLAEARSIAVQLQPAIDRLAPSRDAVYLQVNFATQLAKLQADSAAPLLATAIRQAQSLGDRRAESYATGQLGYLYEQRQQWPEARSLSQQALLLAQSANANDVAYRWQWQLGRILRQSDSTAAKVLYGEALQTLESIRRDLLATQPEFQVSFRQDVEPLYRELVELLVEDNPSSEALQQARLAIEALRIAELENFFRSACLDATAQIDSVDDRAAVFYPILLRDRLLVIVSLPNQPLRYHTAAVSLTEVESTVAAFRRSLILPYTSDRDIQSIARRLYGWLIEPVAPALSDSQIETLVFVQDGALQTIPMAALYDGNAYLIETYSIALTPGLQLFEPKPSSQIPLRAVTAGLTESRQGFESLEFVEVELAQIRSQIPSALLLDRDFTSTALADKLAESPASILHIATHGQFSSQADQTFILAWDQPITIDRFTRLLEARGQQPDTLELLVLSACETAIGDSRAALGLAGIAVQSGARSTVASLWLIDDQSTPLLMTEFYQSLKDGLSKTAALQQAQRSLLQTQYRHPRYWAAFVLLGNWQ